MLKSSQQYIQTKIQIVFHIITGLLENHFVRIEGRYMTYIDLQQSDSDLILNNTHIVGKPE